MWRKALVACFKVPSLPSLGQTKEKSQRTSEQRAQIFNTQFLYISVDRDFCQQETVYR